MNLKQRYELRYKPDDAALAQSKVYQRFILALEKLAATVILTEDTASTPNGAERLAFAKRIFADDRASTAIAERIFRLALATLPDAALDFTRITDGDIEGYVNTHFTRLAIKEF